MVKDLILFPFGGNSREALLAVFEQNRMEKTWNVIGFIDDSPALKGEESLGVKVMGGREVLERHPQASVLAVPGSPDSYLNRAAVIQSLNLTDNRLAVVIDPSARISPDAVIGRNTLVMANVVISCAATIGSHCVILPNTVVSHDADIGDYTLIGSNVSVSGACAIKTNCYIGSGSRIKNNITIGEKTLIGIGSCVVKDVASGRVAAGNPAKVLRKAIKPV